MIKNTCKEVIKIESLPDFNRFVGRHSVKFSVKVVPPVIPRSPEVALLARQLALFVKYGIDEKLKAQWQNYWLSCCLSSKCDYIFAVLGECEIEREEDIVDLWDKGILWNYLGSEHGRSYYFDQCLKFLLRRYTLVTSLRLWRLYGKLSFSAINLVLPRLIGTILIGYIPLVSSQEVWEFPSKLQQSSEFHYRLLFGSLLGASLLYLLIECRNTIGTTTKKLLQWRIPSGFVVFCRTIIVFIFGLLVSIGLSWAVIFPLLSPYIPSINVSCWQTKLLFSALALFIGIFIQVFWEEKTITEPL